jgi:hypothetical protein
MDFNEHRPHSSLATERQQNLPVWHDHKAKKFT